MRVRDVTLGVMRWAMPLLMLLTAACASSDLTDAFPPPEPVNAGAIRIEREVAFGDDEALAAAWATEQGHVVLCTQREVVVMDAGGVVLSRTPYGIEGSRSIIGRPSLWPARDGVLLYFRSRSPGVPAEASRYGWIAVSPDGTNVRTGPMGEPLVLDRPQVVVQPSNGGGVIAWQGNDRSVTLLDTKSGRTLTQSFGTGQKASKLWGWLPDRKDGTAVLVVEVKRDFFQVAEPTLWVLEPDFAAGEINRTESRPAQSVESRPIGPGYMTVMLRPQPELVMSGFWGWPEGIERRIRVTDRIVTIRSDARSAPSAIVGPTLLGTGRNGELTRVRIESYLPGVEPGQPLKYQAGPGIVVRTGDAVVARSAVLDGDLAVTGAQLPLNFVVGPGADGRQLCAFAVSDRLVFYSIDPAVVRDLRSPVDHPAVTK